LEEKQQLEPELPTTLDPQLPEIIAAATADTGQDELKNESQSITAAERESPEQITAPTNTSMKKQKTGRSSSINKPTAAKTKSSKIKKKSK
jgi:hypothetical protein